MSSAAHKRGAAHTIVPYPSLREFEAGEILPEKFDHRAHVYVGWSYLQKYSVAESVARFTAALRRLTCKLGAQEKYNETITWFFLFVIAERIAANPSADWERFCADNSELLSNGGALLRRYYTEERLNSRQARQQFVLPNLAGLRESAMVD